MLYSFIAESYQFKPGGGLRGLMRWKSCGQNGWGTYWLKTLTARVRLNGVLHTWYRSLVSVV